MRIALDTNVLVRVLTGDDPVQAASARKAMTEAKAIVLSIVTLCELVWVLRRGYLTPDADIAAAVRTLLDTRTVVMDRQRAEAGLEMLEAGGDFADGVIAYDSRNAGCDVLLSFDRHAVQLLNASGHAAKAPGARLD